MLCYSRTSLLTQMVKNLPAMQETWVRSLGWEDPLEEGRQTPSSILAWRISMDRGAWQVTVHGVAESRTQLKQLSTYAHAITTNDLQISVAYNNNYLFLTLVTHLVNVSLIPGPKLRENSHIFICLMTEIKR